MKQTQNTHVCSLEKEVATAYSIAREVAAAVTRESIGGSVLSGTGGKVMAVRERKL